jgi:glutaredoxin
LLKRKSKKIRVDIYSKADCPLCDKAKDVIVSVQDEFGFEIHEIDITQDSRLFEQYKESIPVIFIDGRKAFKYRVDPKELRKKLRGLPLL